MNIGYNGNYVESLYSRLVHCLAVLQGYFICIAVKSDWQRARRMDLSNIGKRTWIAPLFIYIRDWTKGAAKMVELLTAFSHVQKNIYLLSVKCTYNLRLSGSHFDMWVLKWNSVNGHWYNANYPTILLRAPNECLGIVSLQIVLNNVYNLPWIPLVICASTHHCFII